MAKADPTARIVLTTYNKTLAVNLKAALKTLDPDLPVAQRLGETGVYIEGIDALGYAVLNQTGDIGTAAEAVLGYRAGIDHAHVPAAAAMRSVPEEEQVEALLRERSLLYVAASRARDALVVTWIGRKSALLGSSTD